MQAARHGSPEAGEGWGHGEQGESFAGWLASELPERAHCSSDTLTRHAAFLAAWWAKPASAQVPLHVAGSDQRFVASRGRGRGGSKGKGQKIKEPDLSIWLLVNLVRLAGIEPTTPWFVAKYSIQLSYSRLVMHRYKYGLSGTGSALPVLTGSDGLKKLLVVRSRDSTTGFPDLQYLGCP